MDEEQTAVEEAEENAALEAGFGDTDQEPVAVVAEEEGEVKAEPEIEKPAEEAAKPLTVEDLREIIEEQKRQNILHTTKLSGQIGELSERQKKLEAAKASVSGISPKARERLSADFPELAEMLFSDDGEAAPAVVQKVVAVPSGPTAEDVEDAKELLQFDHPDWETVVVSPEFNAWTATLPPKIAKRLAETYDPAFVSDKLTKFKMFQAAKTPAVKPVIDTTKQERLESAVTPRGVPRTATSSHDENEEETAMLSAYSGKK
jgi:hypothetical protein